LGAFQRTLAIVGFAAGYAIGLWLWALVVPRRGWLTWDPIGPTHRRPWGAVTAAAAPYQLRLRLLEMKLETSHLGAAVFCCILLLACGESEIERLASPDMVFDAVVTRQVGGGATVSSLYSVYLVPHGARNGDSDAEIFRASRVGEYGIDLEWVGGHELHVTHDCSRVWKSASSWPKANSNKKVAIVVKSETEPCAND